MLNFKVSTTERHIVVCASSENLPTEKQINFWNRFTFLYKHLILLKNVKEPFSGILVNISNCRAFSPFKTVPGSLISMHKLGEFVH